MNRASSSSTLIVATDRGIGAGVEEGPGNDGVAAGGGRRGLGLGRVDIAVTRQMMSVGNPTFPVTSFLHHVLTLRLDLDLDRCVRCSRYCARFTVENLQVQGNVYTCLMLL